MSWRFRQSFKIMPGLRLNLSKSGLSASIGGAPFTLSLSSRGAYATASIPGTGISFRQHLSGESPGHVDFHSAPSPELASFPNPPPLDLPGPMEEIRSASAEFLTSGDLADLKRLILTVYQEHEQISSELSVARQEDARATDRFRTWDQGFLLKNVFKGSFSARRAEAQIASGRLRELEEQLQLTTIATQVELAPGQAEPFFKMRDDFTTLAECAAIWDIKAQQRVDRFHQRTLATRAISREKVQFNVGHCELINWEQAVPHLKNATGGDLFLYPGFILYRASRTAFSVIDFHDVEITAASVSFHEEDGVPADSEVIGQTWAKTNKDGTRDKRFADNYQIPVAQYGDLTLKSDSGLWEEFQFSDPKKLERFAGSWKTFVRAFDHHISVMLKQEEEVAPPVGDLETPENPKAAGSAIHFECNKCNQPIEVNPDASGQEFRCPGCGTQLVVPQS